MTKSEYQELVEFLAGKFRRIDERFDGIDERFDGIDERFDRIEGRTGAVETGLQRLGVLVEQNRDDIRGVAEGVTNVDEKLEAFRTEVDVRFDDLHDLLSRVRGE